MKWDAKGSRKRGRPKETLKRTLLRQEISVSVPWRRLSELPRIERYGEITCRPYVTYNGKPDFIVMESENRHRTERRQMCQKDIHAIKEVISKVKSQGLFDQFRKECLADVDTKPAYHNLIQRVEKFVERFLHGQKWSADLNKNQLRETLRRQLNNSGVMNIGVDRIIEQVVNPKILQGIKPKIDEAVCDHLGVDLKARQEEQQKQKQEHQRLMHQQQQFQQHRLPNLISHNVMAEDAFGCAAGIFPNRNTFPWSSDASFNDTTSSGMTDSIGSATGVNFNPHSMGFGGMMPNAYMVNWGPGLPGVDGFNQTMQPMITDPTMILDFGGGFSPTAAPFIPSTSSSLDDVSTSLSTPSMPNQLVTAQDFSVPPPGLPCTHLLSSASSIGLSSPTLPGMSQEPSPVAPPGILANAAGTIIRPPPPGSIPPPPGTVPVIPPTSYTSFQVPHQPVPTTPTLTSYMHKSFMEESTPEVLDLLKTEPFIPHEIDLQTVPGEDLSLPPVHTEVVMTVHHSEAAKQREEMTEFEWMKAQRTWEEEKRCTASESKFEDREDPLSNVKNVFQATKDLSENEETCNLLTITNEQEGRRQGGVLSDYFGKKQLAAAQAGKGKQRIKSRSPLACCK